MDIDKFLNSLSDEKLIEHAAECEKDLKGAAEKCPNSDWHEACFAGMTLFAMELNKRGLKLTKEQ